MSLVLFSMLAYLYAFWCAYVLVMGIYRAHLSRRLVGLNKMLALPVVGFGYLMDVAANLFIAPLVFLDWPREALVTARLIRNPAYGLANVLGYEAQGNPGEVIARRGTWDSDSTNWKVTIWDGAWQVQAQIFYPFGGGRYLRIYIGWKSVSGLPRLMFASHINPFRQWR
ncbi:MAG: hypothetical protein ACK5NE_09445 [Brachymonas sp.]